MYQTSTVTAIVTTTTISVCMTIYESQYNLPLEVKKGERKGVTEIERIINYLNSN